MPKHSNKKSHKRRQKPRKSHAIVADLFGWIALNRSLLDDDEWLRLPFDKIKARLDLTALAVYKPAEGKIRGIPLHLERGQLAISLAELADRWHWDPRTVDAFLNALADAGEIALQKNNVTTVITLLDYDLSQFPTLAKSSAESSAKCSADSPKSSAENRLKSSAKHRRKRREKQTKPQPIADGLQSKETNSMQDSNHLNQFNHLPSSLPPSVDEHCEGAEPMAADAAGREEEGVIIKRGKQFQFDDIYRTLKHNGIQNPYPVQSHMKSLRGPTDQPGSKERSNILRDETRQIVLYWHYDLPCSTPDQLNRRLLSHQIGKAPEQGWET